LTTDLGRRQAWPHARSSASGGGAHTVTHAAVQVAGGAQSSAWLEVAGCAPSRGTQLPQAPAVARAVAVGGGAVEAGLHDLGAVLDVVEADQVPDLVEQ